MVSQRGRGEGVGKGASTWLGHNPKNFQKSNRVRKSLVYRTPHFSAITKRILCLILLPSQMLVVFKSAPILKRTLKVKHAMLQVHTTMTNCTLTFEFILFQLYVLKLLKMQTKYLGRQWRKSNMKTMSAIYTKVSLAAMDLQTLEYVCQIFLHHQHNQTFVFLILSKS